MNYIFQTLNSVNEFNLIISTLRAAQVQYYETQPNEHRSYF
jgi:hypothetical protein